jgi:GH25 family lysozyme M1 (1,4-beta-N-acetylmuramidase)
MATILFIRGITHRALFLIIGVCCVFSNAASGYTCDNGAEVSGKEKCKFFYYFNNVNKPLDPRIALRVGATKSSETRSIALIIGIDTYPHLPNPSINAAAIDVENLKSFIKDKQKFDEIIILQNDNATAENLDYFLDQYLPQRAGLYNHRARVLIAYSGHGIPQDGPTAASFVLSQATNLRDSANLYSLTRVRGALEDLSKSTFHVLALINSCFGGGVFGLGLNGGNPSVSYEPGSYALTAGASDVAVATLGGAKDGSLFFDTLIKGVGTGDADVPVKVVLGDGTIAQSGDVIRLGALNDYITAVFEQAPPLDIAGTTEPFKIPPPWIGAVEPATAVARGGFFFLAPVVVASPSTVALEIPPGPRSSLPGRPDVKVFAASDSYPVHGIDISSFDASADWAQIKSSGITFAYIRASGMNGQDRSFEKNWAAAAENGVDWGPYFVVSYCRPSEEQINQITAVLRSHKSDLPPALDVEEMLNVGAEGKCLAKMSNQEFADRIFNIAAAMQSAGGRTPVIYSDRHMQERLGKDSRYRNYMVWLGYRAPTGKADPSQIKFKGDNPWTLWQFEYSMPTHKAYFPYDQNVFFGTKDQYREFKKAVTNTALKAVAQ